MALDEPKETDRKFTIGGFEYIIDKSFLETVQPITVDFQEVGFKLTAGVDLSAGSSCTSCGTSGSCCS